MEEAIVNREINKSTGCGDVVRLLEYKGERGRNYSLFKICNYRSKLKNWHYMLMIDDDKFPVLITEDEANNFIEEPEKGASLALNIWFDRYR